MKAAQALLLLAAALLLGCSTPSVTDLPHTRQLSEPVPLADTTARNGSFLGLDRTARGANGKLDLNVLLVHGIGWTENAGAQIFGHDLISALNKTYGVQGEPFSQSTRLCPQSERRGSVARKAPAGGVLLHVEGSSKFIGDDERTPLDMAFVGCLDKTKIDVAGGTINIYRLLWDDTFYNALSYPLIGYDDSYHSGHEARQSPDYAGYESLPALRRPGTAQLRDGLLTYGMTDAALYMGPVGRLMRAAVRGAICATINDLTGRTSQFSDLTLRRAGEPYGKVEVSAACALDTPGAPAPLAIVAESLGSRIVFDVLSREPRGTMARKLSQVSNADIEVYLIANQIPLIAASQLTPKADKATQPAPEETDTRIKYVAFTEVDDLLSYELVPYFEHLAYLRCRPRNTETKELMNPQCGARDPADMVRLLKPDRTRRQALVKQLGFDVVDVRVKFSSALHPLKTEFANYQQAHTGYLRNAQVLRALVYGISQTGESSDSARAGQK